MKTREKFGWVIGFAILLGGCLQSCVTERKVEKYLKKNPLFASEWCAEKYPVKEKFIKGKDSIIEKTVEVKGDSIPCPPNEKGEVVKVKCPDQKIVYQNVYRTDTVEKENTAKLDYYKLAIQDLNSKYILEKKDNEDNKSKSKNRLFIILIIAGILSLYIFLKIKRIISF